MPKRSNPPNPLYGHSGSQRELAEGTLASWLRTGDGCYLDNADPDTLREICRILAARLPDVPAHEEAVADA